MLRNFIVGEGKVISTKQYKQAMLRGLILIVLLVIGVGYTLMDAWYSVYRKIPYYVGFSTICLISF